MLQHFGSSLPAATIQSQENQMFADFEGMLSGSSAGRGENERNDAPAEGRWMRRMVPLVLLAGIGAALALVPMGLKPGMVTGRSVAQAPPGR